jgi:hypothetical protein
MRRFLHAKLLVTNVGFCPWLCKNASAEALMPGAPGTGAVFSDFPEFAVFSFWNRF